MHIIIIIIIIIKETKPMHTKLSVLQHNRFTAVQYIQPTYIYIFHKSLGIYYIHARINTLHQLGVTKRLTVKIFLLFTDPAGKL